MPDRQQVDGAALDHIQDEIVAIDQLKERPAPASLPLAADVVLGQNLPRGCDPSVPDILDAAQRFLQQGEMDVLALEAVVVVQPTRIHLTGFC